jgi:large subunit ribosomal protein L29
MKMKVEELRDMSDAELQNKLAELKNDFCKARLGMQTENPVQVGLIKKDIARVQTIIRERELGLHQVKKA